MKWNGAVGRAALVGFIVGNGMALGYEGLGNSLLFLKGDCFRVLLLPANFVACGVFDLVGYSAAITLASLATGLAYSAIATSVTALLQKLLSQARSTVGGFEMAELRREENLLQA